MTRSEERLFPEGPHRRAYLAEVKELSEDQGVMESQKIGIDIAYRLKDSGLYPSPSDEYPSDSFAGYFREVIPSEGHDLGRYLKKVFKNGGAIGIEFGGQGKRLFMDLNEKYPGLFSEFFGIALGEYEEDKKPAGHTFIAGDLTVPETYRALEEKLGGRKANFIVERMVRGLNYVPFLEPARMAEILGKWYELLDTDGILLLEIPSLLRPLQEAWVAHLRRIAPETLEVSSVHEKNGEDGLLLIRKLPGAPESLPLLDIQTVKRLPREYF